MKTALRAIIVIAIEIAVMAGLLFACVQIFPDEDEVVITEDFGKEEGGNIGGNAGAALED